MNKGSALGIRRLTKEHLDLQSSNNPNFVAEPDPDNLFHWHYVIYNLKDCPYEGGYYHGMLKFPPEYPMKPPSVLMITPSGRFQCKQRICLTISDWHPESWNPVWKVESILMGLLSFMLSEEGGIGSITSPENERKKFAKDSMNFNMKNTIEPFAKIFDSHFVKLGLREAPKEEPVLAKKPSAKKGAAAIEEPAPLEKKASTRKGAAAKEEPIPVPPALEKKTSARKGAAAAKEEPAPVLGKKASAAKAAVVEEEKKGDDKKKRDAKAEEKKDKKPIAAAAAPAEKDNANFIYVQCVKVGPKIRLRIVNSTNYNNGWNCQGPRNIRIEGVVYRIDDPKVKVMYGGPGKASFYKLSNDASIYKQVMSGAVGVISKEDLKK